MLFILIILMVVIVAGALFFAFHTQDDTAARVASVQQRPEGDNLSVEALIASRRRNVRKALKELEGKKTRQRKSMTLRQRLNQAGFTDVPEMRFWLVSGTTGAIVLLLCVLSQQTLLITALLTLTFALGLPRWVLSFLQNRRRQKFTNDFANALDVIIRSVRSGLPTFEAMKVVATDFREPVSGEFSRLLESVRMGMSLTHALERMYENMPTPEVGFFSVVMSIQQQSGGNLAEALGNLTNVLRDRKRLEAKIQSLSSEAKTTAGIIGSLPIAVMILLYIASPEYIMVLFTEKSGNLLIGGCLLWMAIGIFIMKKMINFKR